LGFQLTVIERTILVSRTRYSALALLRRAGTQESRTPFLVAWAPALQRIAEEALRCVRGTAGV